jgi:hypothetical protein
MSGFVGSVSGFCVQLDVLSIGLMLLSMQNSFNYILCFLSVYIDVYIKKNVSPMLCYSGMENKM